VHEHDALAGRSTVTWSRELRHRKEGAGAVQSPDHVDGKTSKAQSGEIVSSGVRELAQRTIPNRAH
jgi:hypothetical protein